VKRWDPTAKVSLTTEINCSSSLGVTYSGFNGLLAVENGAGSDWDLIISIWIQRESWFGSDEKERCYASEGISSCSRLL
jgi:hypothetical protein